MNLRELGVKIQTAREEKNFSQEQLADAIGCSQPALSNYEKGKRRIYLQQLEKLSEVLDKPLSYFVDNLEFKDYDIAPYESSSPNLGRDLILPIINNIYRLDPDEIAEVNKYILYLLWKKGRSYSDDSNAK